MSASRPRSIRRIATIAAVSALGVSAAPAHAGMLVADAPDCASLSQSQVFMPWADVANYQAAPGGSVENGTDGWSSLNGASVVAGNESYNVGGAADSHSLSIPDGASATTGETCVGIDKPDARFFVRRKCTSSPLATLKVEVLWEDATGADNWTTAGVVGAASSWQPTAQMVLAPSLLALLPGSQTPVALRFTASGGDFFIDDVYIDPYGGH